MQPSKYKAFQILCCVLLCDPRFIKVIRLFTHSLFELFKKSSCVLILFFYEPKFDNIAMLNLLIKPTVLYKKTKSFKFYSHIQQSNTLTSHSPCLQFPQSTSFILVFCLTSTQSSFSLLFGSSTSHSNNDPSLLGSNLQQRIS